MSIRRPDNHHLADSSTASSESTKRWNTRSSSWKGITTELPTDREEKGIFGHAQEVVKGAKDAVVDGAQGMWDMLKTGFNLLNPFDRDKQVKTYEGVASTAKAIWKQPTVVLEAIIEPIESRVEQKRYGEALGYAIPDLLLTLLGTKGASVATKVDDAVKARKVVSKTVTLTIPAPSVTKVVHKGVTRTMLTGEGFSLLPRFGKIDPHKIRFTQDTVASSFRPPHGSVQELIIKLKTGAIDPAAIKPIRLVEKMEKFTLSIIVDFLLIRKLELKFLIKS